MQAGILLQLMESADAPLPGNELRRASGFCFVSGISRCSGPIRIIANSRTRRKKIILNNYQ